MNAADLLQPVPDPLCKITISCPRALVGRLIGKNGVTIKALQLLTRTIIEIDQFPDPSSVLVLGASTETTDLALSIIRDILSGNFKGFALLRDVVTASRKGVDLSATFVYAPGIGLLPRRQMYIASSSAPSATSCQIDSDDQSPSNLQRAFDSTVHPSTTTLAAIAHSAEARALYSDTQPKFSSPPSIECTADYHQVRLVSPLVTTFGPDFSSKLMLGPSPSTSTPVAGLTVSGYMPQSYNFDVAAALRSPPAAATPMVAELMELINKQNV